ncbi:MAG: RdgB/HAM1 family non-canonical purine NTP pyrophosphatase [Kofleriaceae bacterium]
MTRPLVFATRNAGKVTELRALVPDGEVLTIAAAEARLGRAIPEVVEDGATFAANAIKKARAVAEATGWPALADDSGLEVDALGGAPGVYSARYAGVDGPGHDQANCAKLLVELDGVPAPRTARFRSVVALADPHGPLGAEVVIADGVCDGEILTAARGDGGFGYDPLFFCPALGVTFAEATVAAKNALSHRGRAMAELAPRLRAYLTSAG